MPRTIRLFFTKCLRNIPLARYLSEWTLGRRQLQAMKTDDSTKAEWVKTAMDRYERPLISHATLIVGHLEGARDVVQDTFLRLCAEDPVRLDSHLAEWLFTVCRNRALDARRKESRVTPLDEAKLSTQTDHAPSPAALAERHDTVSLALRLLGSFPPNQQEVVRLKFQNGLSYAEISRVTQLTVSNVGFLLHTAIKTLRQRLKTEAGDSFFNAERRPS